MVIIWLMMVHNVIWLVVEPYPSEKWWSSSVGMMFFPTEWTVMKFHGSKPPEELIWLVHFWSMAFHVPRVCCWVSTPASGMAWYESWQMLTPAGGPRKSLRDFGTGNPWEIPRILDVNLSQNHKFHHIVDLFWVHFFHVEKQNRVCMPQNTSLLAFSSRSPERGALFADSKHRPSANQM